MKTLQPMVAGGTYWAAPMSGRRAAARARRARLAAVAAAAANAAAAVAPAPPAAVVALPPPAAVVALPPLAPIVVPAPPAPIVVPAPPAPVVDPAAAAALAAAARRVRRFLRLIGDVNAPGTREGSTFIMDPVTGAMTRIGQVAAATDRRSHARSRHIISGRGRHA